MVKLCEKYDRPKQPAPDARFDRRTPWSKRFENQKPSLRYKRARYYHAELGRFIGRDPLGFVDGMSLYRAYFVPGGIDPWGWTVIADDENISGPTPGCFNSVPKCPCTLASLKALPGTISKQKDYKLISDLYHPGSSECWRIWIATKQKYADGSPVQSGNQCCYDSKGGLITWGPGAGTPDEYGPDAPNVDHRSCDVAPYDRLCEKYGKNGWREYHNLGWEPINAPGCTENPKRPVPPRVPTVHDRCRKKCQAEVEDIYSGPSNEAQQHFLLCMHFCLEDLGL